MAHQQGGRTAATLPPPLETLSRLRSASFDLLVVGGGITGTAIAREAALRGLSVALVERGDFASATSSRSSRLIHGGIRYLEHGHLRLVMEASSERRRLLRLAPHLVRPLEFTWPVYRGARIGRLKLSAGLALYDALSAFRNVRRHRRLSRAAVLAREPALEPGGLTGGAAYFDACTDDTRLTLANAIGARDAGAVVANHFEVTGLRFDDGRVRGAMCLSRPHGAVVEVSARVVVNATGPWTSGVRALEEPVADQPSHGSKGVHILVPREAIGNVGAVTLVSPIDGRVMFALPAGKFTLVGTTETSAPRSLDAVRATESDVSYLLESAGAYFGGAGDRLRRGAVVSAWAGVRPLAAHDGDAGSASREHAISVGPRGMITVTGGKLTTYRVIGSQVVDQVQVELGGRPTISPTLDAPLPGGDVDPSRELAVATRETGAADVASRLVRAHGSRWSEVWEIARARPALRERLSEALPYTLAECVHAVRSEMARNLGDLLIRRVPLAFESADHGVGAVDAVLDALSDEPGWRDADRGALLAEFHEELDGMFTVERDQGSTESRS
jgi:glycerol-3-phosphate dehydrogenase